MANRKISDLTANTNPSLTGVTAVVDNGTTYKSTLQTLRNKLVDSGSHVFTGSQVINGNVTISDSTKFGNSLDDIHQFTGSIKITGSLQVGKNATLIDDEIFNVESSGSNHIGKIFGNSPYYAELTLRNRNSTSNASTDFVVEADNATDSVHYIDLGINSSTNLGGTVGYANDSYLINAGKDMYVGTLGGPSHPAKLFLFAENLWYSPQISISGSKQVGFNTNSVSTGYVYEFSGSAKFNNNVNINGLLTLNEVSEVINVDGGYSGNKNFDFTSGSIFYLTGLTGNGTWNVINVPTTSNRATTFTFVVIQNGTPYSGSQYQINNSNVTVKWIDNQVSTGSANGTDVIGLSAFRVNSSWDVYGTLTRFV